MELRSLGIVIHGVLIVSVCQVGVVRSFFEIFGLIVFCRFMVVVGCLLVMTASMVIMLPGLGHSVLLNWFGGYVNQVFTEMLLHFSTGFTVICAPKARGNSARSPFGAEGWSPANGDSTASRLKIIAFLSVLKRPSAR
jgi:hypothetical protein